MVEDLEVGISFDTDQAINDLENDLQQADITGGLDLDTEGGAATGGGAGGIAEAAGLAEIGSDIGSGAGGAGIAGRLSGALAGISAPLVALVGLLTVAVGFLALLEPVQQALSFIVSQFELLIIPFISLLTPVLQKLNEFMVEALKFFRNPTGTLFGNDTTSTFETAGSSSVSRTQSLLGGATGQAFGTAIGTVAGLGNAGALISPMFADLSDEAKKERQASEVEKQEQEFFGGVFN